MARQKKADLLNFFRQQIEEERPKKTRKTRKPMSEEQKLAAAERLKKAREKRMKENPPQYKNVHPSVLRRSDADPLNFVAVKGWIAINKEKLSEARKDVKAGVKSSGNIVSSIS